MVPLRGSGTGESHNRSFRLDSPTQVAAPSSDEPTYEVGQTLKPISSARHVIHDGIRCVMKLSSWHGYFAPGRYLDD